jgi:hypothetical protein
VEFKQASDLYFFKNGLMSILNAARLIHSATWEFKSRVVLAEL